MIGINIGISIGGSAISDPYGPENVINGTFDSNLDGWVNSWWQWSNGRAYYPFSSNFNPISQACVPANKTVLVKFDYEIISGVLQCRIDAVAITGAGLTGTGTFEYEYTNGTGSIQNLDFGRTFPDAEAYIDNVSVKEIL